MGIEKKRVAHRAADMKATREDRAWAIEEAKQASTVEEGHAGESRRECSVDIIHFEGARKVHKDAPERELRIYERFVFKGGRLDCYLYFNPLIGLTAEEREVMRGE